MNEYRMNDGSIVGTAELRQSLFPSILPKVLTAEVLAPFSINAVLQAPKPASSSDVMNVVRDGAKQDGLGNWVQAYKEVAMFADTTDEDGNTITKAQHEATFRAAELQKLKDAKIATIDKATEEAILELASVTKQRNYLAKYNELLEKKVDGTITAEETTEMATLKGLWASIETLVTEGNAKEAAIQAAADEAAIEAI